MTEKKELERSAQDQKEEGSDNKKEKELYLKPELAKPQDIRSFCATDFFP